MVINGIEVDRGKFIGNIKVRADGKVQVVTILSDGNESIKWASWEEIKRAVVDVLAERAEWMPGRGETKQQTGESVTTEPCPTCKAPATCRHLSGTHIWDCPNCGEIIATACYVCPDCAVGRALTSVEGV